MITAVRGSIAVGQSCEPCTQADLRLRRCAATASRVAQGRLFTFQTSVSPSRKCTEQGLPNELAV